MVYKWESCADDCDNTKEEKHWPGHKNSPDERGLYGEKLLWCEECKTTHKFARYIDTPGQARRATGKRVI